MAWEKVAPMYLKKDQGTDLYVKIQEYKMHRNGTYELRGTLSRAAAAFLGELTKHMHDPAVDRVRFGIVHDAVDQTKYGLALDQEGLVVGTRSREFSANRFARIVGRHLRGFGYRIPLIPEDDVLVFYWPPADMRTVTLPATENDRRHTHKETPNGTTTP